MASVYKRGGKGKWYAAWMDGSGKQRTKSTGTTDKAAAERLAKKYEADAALRRDGVIDPSEDRFSAEGKRPLLEHLDDYHANLLARGNSEKHCDGTKGQLTRVLAASKSNLLRDLTPYTVQSAIKSFRDDGASLRTCNSYLTAIKSFSRWLLREGRSRADSLIGMDGFNEDTDRKRLRRVLTGDELAWLLETTTNRTLPEHAISGPDRAMLYRVAAGSGLRANELRSLTPVSFDLDGDIPTVTVAAGYSKRRRKDVQPIRRDLATELRPWLKTKVKRERVFSHMPRNTARMLRSDLKAAREAWIGSAKRPKEKELRAKSDFLTYVNAAGEVFDFHAFRHTYVSAIVGSGASVKVAQLLARHSTPTLTIGRYAHAGRDDLSSALESMAGGCSTNAVNVTQNSAFEGDAVRADANGKQRQDCLSSVKKKSPKSSRAAGLSDAVLHDATSCKAMEAKEALVGVEPTVADLQSAALATWLQRLIELSQS
jgi:integrase